MKLSESLKNTILEAMDIDQSIFESIAEYCNELGFHLEDKRKARNDSSKLVYVKYVKDNNIIEFTAYDNKLEYKKIDDQLNMIKALGFPELKEDQLSSIFKQIEEAL